MLLIYTHKITPRFVYIMKHIFVRMLGMDITFTTRVEDFIAHTGPKITYSRQPLQKEFFIRSHELLFEQGITDQEVTIHSWDEIPCFFPTNQRSDIPYDIFAASFYMLSRYEEYLPHVKDSHGRYPATESLAFKEGFLEKPVVDIWVQKLRVALKERFPEAIFHQNTFSFVSLVDVAISHCFKHRGILRTTGGTLLDFFTFRWGRMFKRFGVLLGLKKDPYDNFTELLSLHKKYTIQSVFFVLIADYSQYDKNISLYNHRFRSLIKSIADYTIVSLMASYDSYENLEALKKGRSRLIKVINRPVKRVRLRYNRVNIPETYKLLVEAECNEDYTMGYTHYPGFRAGTCSPFYFYDISYEVQLPLKINPFCLQDYSFINQTSASQIMEKISVLIEEVKKVNGTFMTVFSNEVLGGSSGPQYKKVYEELVKKLGSER